MLQLTTQEHKIITFLSQKQEVFWEELAQFCKNPSTVKLKTVQKIVSDLRKKYRDNNLLIPFQCTFKTLDREPKMVPIKNTTTFNGQELVQIKRNITRVIVATQENKIQSIVKPEIHHTQTSADFTLRPYTRQVLTKSGIHNLNNDEYDIFDYFISNRGRFISLEELRDKVCYPKFGSKTPARWFSAIQRRVGNIRHQIPETKNTLLTAKQNNSSGYIIS